MVDRQLGNGGETDPFQVVELITETGAISAVARSPHQ
jgi:hypothetical protein